MRETTTPTTKIIEDMLSRDPHRIWHASCEIVSLSQNHERIMELVPYKEKMQDATKGMDLGGVIAPNKRFLTKAFDLLHFYEKHQSCPCTTLGEDSNPCHLETDEYVTILETKYYDNSNYVDYYIVRCNKCHTTYKVEEREYHMTWWSWKPIDRA